MAILGAALLGAATLAGCGHPGDDAALAWGPCPDLAAYVTDLGVDAGVVDRLQCATVDVPLDYTDPGGRRIDLAVSRVAGTDPAATTLFVNPGGPGVEGRSMAVTVASELDLPGAVVGIDLRGTGYSTSLDCDEPDAPDTRDDGSLHAYADEIAAGNRECVAADPGFVASITTANAARDLDTVRQRLGLDTVDYLGVSWGTVLGAELQTRYPQHLRRVVLDSMDYTGMSAGDALRTLAAADPDVPAVLVPEPSDLGAGDGDGPAPDDPEVTLDPDTLDFLDRAVDGTAGVAYICNSLDPVGDTATQLARNLGIGAELGRDPLRRIEFPADSDVPGVSLCSGWPLPGEAAAVADTGTDLLIVGHRDEMVTPYPWALDAHAAMGGQLLTIEDDVHGSTVGSSCGWLVTQFLDAGTIDESDCTPD
ncbi:alpha/beta fold hydrolase [Prescottella subtropica]|uniref:alpha/beta fold hydrolase n=1 Tax=Prescottella subtropica TaxID=2545757 RepID=UPI001386FF1E|nr:alpha/beta fold hydrolase [Prescottella subtropica]